jgi:hypothetical protein
MSEFKCKISEGADGTSLLVFSDSHPARYVSITADVSTDVDEETGEASIPETLVLYADRSEPLGAACAPVKSVVALNEHLQRVKRFLSGEVDVHGKPESVQG